MRAYWRVSDRYPKSILHRTDAIEVVFITESTDWCAAAN